ncbi:hypothetical protein E4U21_005658 [Claviceps maximensis]|nr:hypothetical protein E4U21_005658 [Claviceps maximensis]
MDEIKVSTSAATTCLDHASERRVDTPCRFFVRGHCRNGTGCPFYHAKEDETEVHAPAALSRPLAVRSQLDTRSRIACRFQQQGSCSKGEKCPFAHDVERNAGEAVVDVGDQDGSMPENWCRELKGALVSFGDGAVVTRVSFPSDFSAVRISNLPRQSTPSSVAGLLSSLGFDVAPDCIRVITALADGDTHCVADVRVEDTHFSKQFCEALADNKDHGDLQAVPINAPMPRTTNYRRVDSKKVYCSWHKPTKKAWLNYGSQDVATRVSSKFSAGVYQVLGQKVRCEGLTRSGGQRNPMAWTIRLLDIPAHAQKADVTKPIFSTWGPRHVELSAPSYDVDLPMANTLIESLLLQAGPLERWEGGAEGAGKRFKAKAWFMNDADARQAVKSFHNKPLSFNSHGKLTVQLVHSARLKVPTRVYDVVKEEIAEHKQAWASQHLIYMAYPPDSQGLRVLKIEGEIAGDVARAKTTLERIIDGEVLVKDGTLIWSPSFAANGHAYQAMKQLERDLGILVVRDKRRARVQLLGPRSQRQKAQQALIELAQSTLSSVHTIELTTEQFSRAFKGGYRAITAAIGQDKVVLDVASSPRRILVAGSEDDVRVAQEILQDGHEGKTPWTKQDNVSTDLDCAVCWTEAENPVHTACKHVYCAGCFADLCYAGVQSEPCIRCQGDAGECGEILPRAELQKSISSAILEDVLETAFTTYIARRAADLKNCPTPDCTQIYRSVGQSTHRQDDVSAGGHVTAEKLLFQCPSCLMVTCTACNVSHEGQTCAEYRDVSSGGFKLLEATKKKLGIKDCPKCGVMIEKLSGCNHMCCTKCKAHICWVCLKTFAEGSLVYDHMRRKHGGIGIDYYPEFA